MLINYLHVLIGVISLVFTNIHAQSNKWDFPNSPTGKAATAILIAIEHGDDDFTARFLEESCTGEFLSAFPLQAHLRVFRDLHEELGKFEVSGVKKTGPFSAELLIQSQQSNNGVRIRFELDSQPPHQIASLFFEPVSNKKQFSNLSELDTYLQELTSANKFSGAILIAKNGKPLFRKAYGYASKRFNVSNTVETKFNIGSINKIFTKIAIYQLHDLGKLDLDDTIDKYLPNFPKAIAEKVIIRHLLEHRSGMGHYWNEKYRARFSELRTVDDYLNLIKDEPLAFEPGTSEQYSNSGYVVLGAIIEKVTGQDYFEYIRTHVYEPAGMTNSDHYELDRPVPNLATGYTNQNPDGSRGVGFERNNFYYALKGSPAGGGYSTVDDLLKFDLALQEGIPFPNPSLKTVEVFHRSGGLGIAGGGPGCNAILESDWQKGYTVVVLSNYDPPTGEELGLEIMAMLRNKNL